MNELDCARAAIAKVLRALPNDKHKIEIGSRIHDIMFMLDHYFSKGKYCKWPFDGTVVKENTSLPRTDDVGDTPGSG